MVADGADRNGKNDQAQGKNSIPAEPHHKFGEAGYFLFPVFKFHAMFI
jgi:hypothetical protein